MSKSNKETLSKQINVRLTPSEYEKIENIAKEDDRDLTYVIRKIVKAELERIGA